MWSSPACLIAKTKEKPPLIKICWPSAACWQTVLWSSLVLRKHHRQLIRYLPFQLRFACTNSGSCPARVAWRSSPWTGENGGSRARCTLTVKRALMHARTHPLPPQGLYVTLYKAFLSVSQARCVYSAMGASPWHPACSEPRWRSGAARLIGASGGSGKGHTRCYWLRSVPSDSCPAETQGVGWRRSVRLNFMLSSELFF